MLPANGVYGGLAKPSCIVLYDRPTSYMGEIIFSEG
jgi:hypothetical protein